MRAALLLLAGCVRTPPHADWNGRVTVENGWRVASPPTPPCDWQGEALVRDGTVLWGELPDRFEGPCPTGGERSRLVTVDIVGRDGPFVSTVLRARGPIPVPRDDDRASTTMVSGAEGDPSATPPPPAASTVAGPAAPVDDGAPLSLAALQAAAPDELQGFAFRPRDLASLAVPLDPAGALPPDARFWEHDVAVPPLASGTSTCVTWDLRTGRPARLVDYDAKHAPARWRRATRRAARAGFPALSPGAFVVGDGHVAFCVPEAGGEMRWVRVR